MCRHPGRELRFAPAHPPCATSWADVSTRAQELAKSGRRVLLGLTGAPGAGKSTLGKAIVEHVGDSARLVGMDGFHLAQARLGRLGRLDRKGAPDTFDGEGFVALVRRLRARAGETVYAPEFDRELDEPIAGAVAVERGVGLVVVEGNYLLVSSRPWVELRSLFDKVWYCERDEHDRLTALIARHQEYGKSPAEARRWALGPDQDNAQLIAATRIRADLVVRLAAPLAADRKGLP